jgi:hypothetical protein
MSWLVDSLIAEVLTNRKGGSFSNSLVILICFLCHDLIHSNGFTKVLVPAVYKEWESHTNAPAWAKDPLIQQKYNYSVFLYQKHDPSKPNFIKNRGTEGGVYLKYIVDHYDNFPDVAIFVHGHPEHHQPDFLEYIGCIQPNATYINFNFSYFIRSTHYW